MREVSGAVRGWEMMESASGVATTGLTRRSVLQVGTALAVSACAPRQAGVLASSGAIAAAGAVGTEAIRAAIQSQIDSRIISGAVSAVAQHGRLVWFEAQGYSDPVKGIASRRDDIFRAMSSTKPLTAAAILMMMEEGRLSLDDRVSRFIPSFVNPRVALAPAGAKDPALVKIVPAAREITLRDLLTHTSGLTSAGDSMTAGGAAHLVNNIEKRSDDTLATYVPRLGHAVLDFQPGSRWHYSPLDGMDVLLRIVEIVSRQPADAFMRERVFEPLRMMDTHYHLPVSKRDRLFGIFSYEKDRWQAKDDWLPRWPQYTSGAAGLYSTVHDFLQFELMMLGGGTLHGHRVLKPSSVDMMRTNQVGRKFAEWIPPITGGYGFGLGVRISEDPTKTGRSVGAFGWPGAYGTDAWADPALDLAAVLFIQMNPLSFAPSNAFAGAVTKFAAAAPTR